MKRVYSPYITEEKLIDDLMTWVGEKGDRVERADIIEGINNLYEMEISDFDNGFIFLKEYVWGKV